MTLCNVRRTSPEPPNKFVFLSISFFHWNASAARSVLKSCSSNGIPEVSDQGYRVFRWQRFWLPNGVFVCTIRLRSRSELSIKSRFVERIVHIDHRLSFIQRKKDLMRKDPRGFCMYLPPFFHAVSVAKSNFKSYSVTCKMSKFDLKFS